MAAPAAAAPALAAATAMAEVTHGLASLRDLPARYAGVLLDQFGVLHDGSVPYPDAIAAVRHLAFDRGLRVLIISNSSRRSAGTLGNLARMGFPEKAFAGAITSGEVTHELLAARPDAFWAARRTALHLTWGARGAISLDGLGLELTADPLACDFILAHGVEAVGGAGGADAVATPLPELRALLEAAARSPRRPPLVCANPDLVTVAGAGGALRTMPGKLAKWYAAAGGEVHLMGKPAPVIYARALAMLGLPPGAVVAVGDSLEHDVAGAAAAGVDSVLVAGGIHAKELLPRGGGAEAEEEVDAAALARLCAEAGAAPTFVMRRFEL